jgi:hypothetical protein
MQATTLDLRRRMPQVLRALARNEKVKLFHRGKEKGVILPAGREGTRVKATAHPAFGMWRKRADLKQPADYVHRLRRKGRHAL